IVEHDRARLQRFFRSTGKAPAGTPARSDGAGSGTVATGQGLAGVDGEACKTTGAAATASSSFPLGVDDSL
ncbi:unnamed protein product, partial [Ectocarpus sp. 4 AP-2014]